MAYPVCLDASIIIKWLVPESDSDTALSLFSHLIDTGAALIEPVLVLYEVPSAMRRKVAKGQLAEDEAAEAFGKFQFLSTTLSISTEDRRRLQRAWEIASTYGLNAIYDSIYLALAEELGAECWTADSRFYSMLSADFPQLKLLSEFTRG